MDLDLTGLPRVVPRPVGEGVIPLIAVEGTAYECGRHYAQIVQEKYPGYRGFLEGNRDWLKLTPQTQRVVEQYAPHLPELFRGLIDGAGPQSAPPAPPQEAGCTSFALHPSVTLDGIPISGQVKDTPPNRIPLYIILRMRIIGAPTIMVLAYPGELLGYGMWSTGMCRWRHDLYAKSGSRMPVLTPGVLPLLTLACHNVHQAVELMEKYCGNSAGGCMLMDSSGQAVTCDSSISGLGLVWMKDGILTRSNHPESPLCRGDEQYPYPGFEADSKYRTHGLRKLFEAESGRLTAQKAVQIMADHSVYPRGQCKHWHDDGTVTTALVLCEPSKGLMHVVRGQPCCNWPVTYTL